jgi:hypothetical protein
MKGIGGIAPRILNLGTGWRWVVSFTPRPLYPRGKSSWYTLDRRLGGSRTRSGRGRKEKNSQPLPELEPPIIQPVVHRHTTALSQLLKLFLYLIKYHAMKTCPLLNHHAVKTQWGSGGIAPRILNLVTRWRWVVSFTPRPLYPRGKSSLFPLDRRLGGPQSQSGCCGEEKNSHHCPHRKLKDGRPVRRLVTTLPELPRLLMTTCLTEI